MGVSSTPISTADTESALLLPTSVIVTTQRKAPDDKFHLAYIIYFILGLGFLLPWNAFITAVDYFSFIYPDISVDRVFAVSYMLVCFVCVVLIVLFAHMSNVIVRINVGLILFVLALIVVPVMDVVYIKGRVGLYDGFYVTACALALSGLADALVHAGVVGSAGELPGRYMQAVLAGSAGSGVLVSFLRIFTKAAYTEDALGLRNSANLYFSVGVVVMVVCVVLYNVAPTLPVIKYYADLKHEAVNEDKEDKGSLTEARRRAVLWEVVWGVKWYGIGIFLNYLVTLSIYPGFITEEVQSETLKDWYPILLIAVYNVFDLVGKSLTAVCLLEDAKVTIGGCFARFVFYPLFFGCLHGPEVFRKEIPVTVLTCLLGLTNGYLTSAVMILAPKTVQLQHAETAGIVMVLFFVLGLAAGSVVSWFWVI